MKVDTSFLQVPLAAAPHKPEPRQTEQATSRPVDRPHHDEPPNNQQTRETEPRAETSRETPQPGPVSLAPRREAELGEHDNREPAERADDRRHTDNHASPQRGGFSANPTQPASVGELLDVIA
jgi:hypothetical protein